MSQVASMPNSAQALIARIAAALDTRVESKWDIAQMLADLRHACNVPGCDLPGKNPNDRFGKAVAVIITATKKDKPSTSKLYKQYNLAINFSHLRPEVEELGVTALYKLNEWAKANPGMTLDDVKAKLAEGRQPVAPKRPSYSWRKQAKAAGFDATAGWDWDNLKAKLTEHNPALTFKKEDADNLQAALEQVYANEHPEDVEAEAEQAAAEFLKNSKAKDPVKTKEQLEAKLRKQYAAQAQKELDAALKKYEAKLEAEVDAKYADLYEKAEARLKEAEELKKGLYEAKQEITFFMTKAEYKLIISCLHTDKEAPPEKKTKALQVMLKFSKVFK